MRVLTLSVLALFTCLSLHSKNSNFIDRIEPPNWYIGMKSPGFQLMLHGEDIAQYEVKIIQGGGRIEGVQRVDNLNYLWVIFLMDPSWESEQTVTIGLFKEGKKKAVSSFDYSFKMKSQQKRGLDQSDLMYLIMPDRFTNGDPTNDIIKGMNETTISRDSMYYRHGGDLQGIINHLDYLEDLGVSSLWLNPVLENNQPKESYHGYAMTDLYKVDPRLGSNDLYKKLIDELHQREMKIIQDVVYNHWGLEHWMIQDLPDSSFIHHWPAFQRTNYRATSLMDPHASQNDQSIMTDGWFDHHMPDLNQKNPLLATYLIQNSLWLIEHFGLDAFRIDTYAYPDQHFMSDLNKHIMKEYPDFFIFGETWVHGNSVQNWFTEGTPGIKDHDSGLMSVTDFQLYYAINDALTKPDGWAEGLHRVYYTLAKDYLYPHPENLVTFLDNHDLCRFYSMVGKDPKKYEMGIGMLFTLRGIPCIYYGTEILMSNFSDPDGKVREDFPGGWEGDLENKFDKNNLNEEERKAFNFLSTLSKFRKNNPQYFLGDLVHFVPQKEVYVYFRVAQNGEQLMVIVNTGQKDQELDTQRFNERQLVGSTAVDIITQKEKKIGNSLFAPAQSIQIIQLKQ